MQELLSPRRLRSNLTGIRSRPDGPHAACRIIWLTPNSTACCINARIALPRVRAASTFPERLRIRQGRQRLSANAHRFASEFAAMIG
jgi:hypothetical protein